MRIPVLFLALVAAALLAEARPWYADRIPNGHKYGTHRLDAVCLLN